MSRSSALPAAAAISAGSMLVWGCRFGNAFLAAPSSRPGQLAAGMALRGSAAAPRPDGSSGTGSALAAAFVAAGVAMVRPARQTGVVMFGKKKGGKGGGGKKGKKGGRGRGDDGGDDVPPGFDAAPAEEAVDTEAIVSEYENKMKDQIARLKENLSKIIVGRATAALLDNCVVQAYDSECSVQSVGSITATDATTLTIQTFDEDVAPMVEKAIRALDLSYGITVRGNIVTCSIPPMTTDKRDAYVKMAKDNNDQAKTAVRNVRQTAMKKIKPLSKKMSEDIVKDMQATIESYVKTYTTECDTIYKKKEKEILTV